MRTVMIFALAAFCAAGSIHASIIGSVAVGSAGDVSATLTTLQFDPGVITGSTALRFAGCASGILGSLGCLAALEGVSINGGAAFGVGAPPVASHFVSLAGNGGPHVDLNFMLTTILPGSANTTCAGLGAFESCSVYAGSPVVLTEFGPNTLASIGLAGVVSDGTLSAPWVGVLSSTFPGINAGQVQQFFCPSGTCTAADFAAGTTLTTSYSGTFAAHVVPEPATSWAIAFTLAAAWVILRRRD